MGFGVWGLGFGVWGLGFRVWGLGFGVWGLKVGVTRQRMMPAIAIDRFDAFTAHRLEFRV